jgi:hypothetical protein
MIFPLREKTHPLMLNRQAMDLDDLFPREDHRQPPMHFNLTEEALGRS